MAFFPFAPISGGRVLLCAAFLLAPGEHPQPDSLQRAYYDALARLSSPELDARMARRRLLQQQGYAGVLHEVLHGDGLAGLMEWSRMMVLLEYSIDGHPLYVYARGADRARDTSLAGRFLPPPAPPVPVRLLEDRSFPVDPWAHGRPGEVR